MGNKGSRDSKSTDLSNSTNTLRDGIKSDGDSPKKKKPMPLQNGAYIGMTGKFTTESSIRKDSDAYGME